MRLLTFILLTVLAFSFVKIEKAHAVSVSPGGPVPGSAMVLATMCDVLTSIMSRMPNEITYVDGDHFKVGTFYIRHYWECKTANIGDTLDTMFAFLCNILVNVVDNAGGGFGAGASLVPEITGELFNVESLIGGLGFDSSLLPPNPTNGDAEAQVDSQFAPIEASLGNIDNLIPQFNVTYTKSKSRNIANCISLGNGTVEDPVTGAATTHTDTAPADADGTASDFEAEGFSGELFTELVGETGRVIASGATIFLDTDMSGFNIGELITEGVDFTGTTFDLLISEGVGLSGGLFASMVAADIDFTGNDLSDVTGEGVVFSGSTLSTIAASGLDISGETILSLIAAGVNLSGETIGSLNAAGINVSVATLNDLAAAGIDGSGETIGSLTGAGVAVAGSSYFNLLTIGVNLSGETWGSVVGSGVNLAGVPFGSLTGPGVDLTGVSAAGDLVPAGINMTGVTAGDLFAAGVVA